MRRNIVILTILIACALLFMSCGQLVGNNPIGATGGGENGYGVLNSYCDTLYVVNSVPIGPMQQSTQAEIAK
jgi:hypothetical protein